MRSSTVASLAMAAVASAHTGFNYGALNQDGSVKSQNDFEADFKAASSLEGTDGKFNSARLYTMVQGGTDSDIISAIPAAVKTDTTLLLGLWASAGEEQFKKELTALKSAIDTYGDKLKDLVVGISIGSEDLYRLTPESKKSTPNPGAEPDTLVGYVKEVRDLIKGTALEGAKLGHVDTWTAWVNGSNSAVVDAVDWLGFDGYPYFQEAMENDIKNSKNLFDDSMEKTRAAANGKPVWITETGWPVKGPDYNKGQASIENAEWYYQNVGCPLFGVENVWWYMLVEAGAEVEFGVAPSLGAAPYYNLTCSATTSSSSAAPSATGKVKGSGSASSGSYATGSASPTGGYSGSGSGSGSGSYASGGSSSATGSAGPSSSGPATITSSAGRLTSAGAALVALAAAVAMI
ncbi:putative glucan endo-1 3-beta-glucosidase eglC [Ceratocystis platani]|uniref:Probable glucan endo-1,3-beta-glucosidase eglC n=1 Tax=Ceratocystis fimbriata f. sp. platani TaxID=88771 RepID=A0A0F8AZI9_CERFI|nr:putative glucan endo-1 3-beta-glucosidase eglC [Ceratocystis platani]